MVQREEQMLKALTGLESIDVHMLHYDPCVCSELAIPIQVTIAMVIIVLSHNP